MRIIRTKFNLFSAVIFLKCSPFPFYIFLNCILFNILFQFIFISIFIISTSFSLMLFNLAHLYFWPHYYHSYLHDGLLLLSNIGILYRLFGVSLFSPVTEDIRLSSGCCCLLLSIPISFPCLNCSATYQVFSTSHQHVSIPSSF